MEKMRADETESFVDLGLWWHTEINIAPNVMRNTKNVVHTAQSHARTACASSQKSKKPIKAKVCASFWMVTVTKLRNCAGTSTIMTSRSRVLTQWHHNRPLYRHISSSREAICGQRTTAGDFLYGKTMKNRLGRLYIGLDKRHNWRCRVWRVQIVRFRVENQRFRSGNSK